MELDLAIRKRRSVRAFKNAAPSWKDVLEAIDAANQAPFAGNHNHLKFICVEDGEKIKELAKFTDQTWVGTSKFIVVLVSDDAHLENQYGDRGRVYSRQQAGAAIQNFLLKIVDLKLATCWIGSYDDSKVRDLFKVPKHMQIEAVLPIGYEIHGKEIHVKKKDLENVLYWEEWDKTKRPTLFKEPPIQHK